VGVLLLPTLAGFDAHGVRNSRVHTPLTFLNLLTRHSWADKFASCLSCLQIHAPCLCRGVRRYIMNQVERGCRKGEDWSHPFEHGVFGAIGKTVPEYRIAFLVHSGKRIEVADIVSRLEALDQTECVRACLLCHSQCFCIHCNNNQ
jgi:hypothetical protein